MPDFASAMNKYQDLPPEEQKKAGQAIGGKMEPKYEEFLKLILGLIERKELNVDDPQTCLKRDVYDALPEEWKDKTDLALNNIGDMLRMIVEFRLSKLTPDESPQLETMIAQLWHMKESIEGKGYDVFKF